MKAYYDMFGMEVELSSSECKLAFDYFKKNSNSFLQHSTDFFDLRTLNTKVNLDCLNCQKVQQPCCDGSPYEFSEEYVEAVDAIVDDVIKTCLKKPMQKDYFGFMHKYGYLSLVGYDQQKFLFNPQEFRKTFVEKDGKCFFFFTDSDGVQKCMLHKYALIKGLDFTTVKPPSCMLCPIDVIRFKTKNESFRLIFALTEKTVGFSRWAKDYLGMVCMSSKNRSKENIKGVFSLDDYVPAYKAQGTSFKSLFGEEAYRLIEKKSREA